MIADNFDPSHAMGSDPLRHGRFRLTPDIRAQAVQRRRMQRELENATDSNNFIMQFQPRVALTDRVMHSAEAIVRWPHRKRGIVSASSFYPLAEQTGQIVRIGAWALTSACTACAAQNLPTNTKTASKRWGVSVNVSARQLNEGVLLQQLAVALEESGLPPELLDLEFAEPMMNDVSLDVLLTLSAIRDLGIGVILDEFGTGLASLALLKRLPLTAIKLDRSLLRHVPEDREDGAILRAIVQVGQALGLEISADGIETQEQRMFLLDIGCASGQGSLLGHPLPAEQLQSLGKVRMPKA